MVDIVFLAVVAVLLLTRLYSVFGSHAEDRKIKVIVKPIDAQTEQRIMEDIRKTVEEHQRTETANEPNLSALDRQLLQIPNFNKNAFMNGARGAFELIVRAFYSDSMDTVKNLISRKVYDAFKAVIAERKEQNLSSEVDFICFDKSEIKNVKILKNSVKIAVEFVTEQVNILKKADGEVIEGDENFIQKITDIWTFERNINAKNEWLLVSTKKSV
ncbi:MAG: Tim44/TimA family putative adaptor protein [Alphaproteobacteria bacterium]|nr:Tim44/TimA family putative adaptor protein [Alphaproteobacteria bacterium]